MRSLTLIMAFFIALAASGSGFAAVSSGGRPDADKDLVTGRKTVKAAAASQGAPKEEQKKYKDDELLVKFKPGTPEEHKKNLHKKHGSEKLKEFPELRLHHVKLKKGMTVEEGVKRYREDSEVEYAEPNFLYSIQGEPGDPRFGELWGLKNTGQTGGTAGADIKATAAWDITTGSSDVIVAVIDTGIDYTHPDLVGNLWTTLGIDTINNDSNPFDDHGHGTHVAGTIGAVGNNGTGVVGVNWNVKLTACKFLGAGGSGSTDGAIQCLQYIKGLKDAGANIVATNNSWGGGSYSQALYDAIDAQRDILFIAAAGNSSSNLDTITYYPAGYDLPNVVVVAATDHNDNKATFSSYGRRRAHISAPGTKILSTLPAVNTWNVAGGYGLLSGTSMATPHVTGLAALLKAQNPARSWSAIKNLILAGGDNIGNMYERTITGKRIDTLGSLTCSGRQVLSVLRYPAYLNTAGTPVTLSALSINCGDPSGPVSVTLSGGEVVTLHDDGVAPDLAAGDGIFSASWTATRLIERLRFSSPAGVETLEYPSLGIATASLPSATINAPYREVLSAAAGYPPYTWSVVAGSLPAGITMNDATGEITGTPTAFGTTFTIQVTDIYGAKSLKDFSLNIIPPGVTEYWRREASAVGMLILGDVQLSDLAVDENGNAYVTSRLASPNPLLLKYDNNGNLIWTRNTFDGAAATMTKAVATGKDGSVYAALLGCSGWVGNSCTYDMFIVAKYDPEGNIVWTRQHQSNDVVDIILDEAGNIYVTTDGAPGYMTVKYDAAGNELWTRNFSMVSQGKCNWGAFSAADKAGNIYVAGYTNTSRDPYKDVVLLKYDSSGTLLWMKSPRYAANARVRDVAVDSRGDVLVTGEWLTSPTALFVLKYDSDGNLLWERSYSATFGTEGHGLAVDRDDMVYITGLVQSSTYGSSDFLTLTYDRSGSLVSALMVDNGGEEFADRIAIGPSGNIYVTGSSDGTKGLLTVMYRVTKPVTTVSPAGGTYETEQTVELTANEPVTIHYTLDGSTPTSASPVYAGPLTISETTALKYFATDSLGHIEAVKTDFYVIHPRAVLLGAPVASTNSTSVTLTVSGARVSSYKYRIDGGTYADEIPVSTPIAIADLGEGSHTVSVLGKDNSGAWQVVPTTASWTVDLTPPTAVVTGSPLSSPRTIFIVGGSDVVAYRYALDGGEYSAVAASSTRIALDSLSEGAHVLDVVGRDAACNWQTIPSTTIWTVNAWPVSLVSGGDFQSIAEAYATLMGDNVLRVKGMGVMENLNFNRGLNVTLRGGFDPATGTADGITTIYGLLEISSGSVTVENLAIAAP